MSVVWNINLAVLAVLESGVCFFLRCALFLMSATLILFIEMAILIRTPQLTVTTLEITFRFIL